MQSMKGFYAIRGFPMCIGAVDGSHIPIKAPTENPEDYYNRKGFHSIVLQGTVDYFGCFIDIFVGFPGRAHDAHISRHSSLHARLEHGTAFAENYSIDISGQRVKGYILGDAAYPLHPTLIKGHVGHHQSLAQQFFTTRLSSARMTVEKTFGRLKTKFRTLSTSIDASVPVICDIITACCVLHNMCED